MPKPKGRGGKNRKKARAGDAEGRRRELIFADDCQCYAFVTGAKGDGRFDIYCGDDRQRTGTVRGKLWKRSWIRQSDVVLASLRDFQEDRADIIHQYSREEARQLIEKGQICDTIKKYFETSCVVCTYEDLQGEGDDDMIVFENGDDMDISRI